MSIELSTTNIATKRKCLVFALIPVFILIAFKANTIGADTRNYLRAFEALARFGDFEDLSPFGYERTEIGYKNFILLLTKISSWPHTLLIALGIMVCYALYDFISRTASNWCLALFFFVTLGFFQFAMSGIRQTLAVSILLIGYRYVQRRNLFKFLITVVVAMMFHKSAIIFAPVYYIAHLKLSLKTISLMFFSMFVGLLFADKLLLTVADVMEYNYGIEQTGNGQIFFAIVLIITLLCLRNKDTLIAKRHSNLAMIDVNFVSMALWCVRLISRTAERVSLYFMPYTYIALEEYISTRSKQDRHIYLLVAVILSSTLFIYRLMGQEQFNQFKFYFEQ